MPVMLTRELRLDRPLDLLRTVAPLRVHFRDPTLRATRDEVVRSLRTDDGPATVAAKVFRGEARVEAGAWGPGAGRALDLLPDLLGEHDSLEGFEPELHPTVAKAHHRNPGLRLLRTGDVQDVLVPAILGQRVTGGEATEQYRSLVRLHAEPAPGPHEGLLLRPEAAWYLAQPEHVYRRLGVERSRERTIRAACRVVGRLQEAATMTHDAAEQRLTEVAGLGIWTAGNIQRIAFGDADAVEVGDYHIKNHVGWALAGEDRATDERMLELLEPWRGHRGRVVRLLAVGAQGAPKYGAKQRIVNSSTITRRRW